MTPTDVTIFELLAAVFTFSFILLIFFIWRFIRNLDLARTRMHGATRDRLQRGAVQFRVRGAAAPSDDESPSQTGR